jgi:protoheme IX farnesyltransferase
MDYLKAAQPRLIALFLGTTLTAMVLAGGPPPLTAAAVLAATALSVGGAALLNNYLERERDRTMARTRGRPTASEHIRPGRALAAGLGATAAGALALWATAGALAAVFALLGGAFYVLVYTLLLKPRLAVSAVPGGLAGVFPALVGWAASGAPWSASLLFLCALILAWSPAHSWALTLALADEYRAAGTPTPATAYGERTARLLIATSVAILTAVTAAPALAGLFGRGYLLVAGAADLVLWAFTLRLLLKPSRAAAWALFKATGPCLAAILAGALAGHLL